MKVEAIGAFEAKTRLIAEEASSRLRLGCDKGRVVVADDFDLPVPGFEPVQPMEVVLDTHAFLWFVTGDRRLGPNARRALERADAEPLLRSPRAVQREAEALAALNHPDRSRV